MSDLATSIAWITFTFAVAGWIKGVVGMGLPTIAMGMLGLVMAPVEAAAILIIPSLVTNVWQLLAGPRFLSLARRFALMMLGIGIGTALGIGFLTSGSSRLPSAALGAALAAYAALGLLSPHWSVPARAEPWLSPLVGLITGVVTGATGVFAIPAVPYLGSLGMEKEELIQALGLSFTVSTVALALALAAAGSFHASVAGSSVFAVLPALAGMFAGQAARNRLHPLAFRRWFFVALFLLGGYMFIRAALFS